MTAWCSWGTMEEERGLFRSEQIARRLAGIRDAMARHGLSFTAELSCWNWEPTHGYELVSGCCNPFGRAACSASTIGWPSGLSGDRGSGPQHPEDIGLVSFDNDELASTCGRA